MYNNNKKNKNRSLKKYGLIVWMLVVLVNVSAPKHVSAESPKGYFLHLTDVHYTTATCAKGTGGYYGEYGCDTNKAVLTSLFLKIQQIQSAATPIAFSAVLVSGDIVGHGLSKAEGLQVMQEFNAKLSSVIPASVPIYYAIGNNDLSPDYVGKCNDPRLSEIALQAYPGRIPSDQLSRWNCSVSYFVGNAFANISLLSLNTVLYSVHHKPSYEFSLDPCGQLDWIRNVSRSATRPILLLGHIPMGIDSYSFDPVL